MRENWSARENAIRDRALKEYGREVSTGVIIELEEAIWDDRVDRDNRKATPSRYLKVLRAAELAEENSRLRTQLRVCIVALVLAVVILVVTRF